MSKAVPEYKPGTAVAIPGTVVGQSGENVLVALAISGHPSPLIVGVKAYQIAEDARRDTS